MISQKPGLRSVVPISLQRNSSVSSVVVGKEESRRRSMTQNTRKANNPIIRRAKANNSGADNVKCRAIGAEMLSAAAVPNRAIANWMPIAKASS